MIVRSSYPLDQLRDYSTLFLRGEVFRWLDDDFSSINQKIRRYDERLVHKNISYLKYLKYVYKALGVYYPNEYIYKNEFLNQWIKDEIGTSRSVVFNEFRVGNAIADLALFNGTSKIFEIKTILDTEQRLQNQLGEYKKIFNEIYVIIPYTLLEKYLSYDKSVGIISYHTSGTFKLERRPLANSTPDYSSIMEVLHTSEYKEIVETYYASLPEMTDFTQFSVCKEMIGNIPAKDLNTLFIDVIKKRKVNNLFFNKRDSVLNQISLSLNLNKNQQINLLEKLNTKINF